MSDELFQLGLPCKENDLSFLTSQLEKTSQEALTTAKLIEARKKVNTSPSDAQIEAGNYAKGHVTWKGLDIAIENPKGSVRSGVSKDGKAWSTTMAWDYGYFKGTKGKDKDHLDVFIGPHLDSEIAFIVNQLDPDTGKLDEHKIMIGFQSEEEAKAGYLANYDKGWKGFGSIKAKTLEQLEFWNSNGNHEKEAAIAHPQLGKSLMVSLPADPHPSGPLTQMGNILGVKDPNEKKKKKKRKKKGADGLGIPNRANYGDMSQLQPGQLVDFVQQLHDAKRSGRHYDVRFGTPQTGAFSWATKKELPEPGEKRMLYQQPIHTHRYMGFQGTLRGYGAGSVRTHRKGQILVTSIEPNKIHFTTADERYPQRYVMLKPQGARKDTDWLMMNITPNKPVPYDKVHMLKIPAEQVEEQLAKLQPGSSVQAKVDGASSLIQLMKNGVEITSYRTSKQTGRPIVHTERILHGRPNMQIPPELVGSVLKGEIYGTHEGQGDLGAKLTDSGGNLGDDTAGQGQVIPGTGQGQPEEGGGVPSRTIQSPRPAGIIGPQTLGGLLNSTVAKSLAEQQAQKIRLKIMLHDAQQVGKMPIDPNAVPYSERQQLIRTILQHLPAETFHDADGAGDPESALALWKQVREGKHPLSGEGIVIHPPTGKPTKAKLLEEKDVHVTGIFPGEGKYHGLGAGGFTYALQPGGNSVGKVGTGLSDQLRRDLYASPDEYIGRVAKIRAQEQHPSGAYRAPSFLAFHEDYPSAEATPM